MGGSEKEDAFSLEDSSEARSEKDFYNFIIMNQVNRIAKILPEIAANLSKEKAQILVVYFMIRQLESMLIYHRRYSGIKDIPPTYAFPLKIADYAEWDTSKRLEFMDNIMSWHDQQMFFFTKRANVLPLRRVLMDMGTGEMFDRATNRPVENQYSEPTGNKQESTVSGNSHKNIL